MEQELIWDLEQEKQRIMVHPILGRIEKGRRVKFTYDGREVEGYEGEPIAAALKAQGVMIHRYTDRKSVV